MSEQNILFHSIGGKAFQESSRNIKIELDEVNPKVMPDGVLLRPIKVFKEGEYVTHTREGKPIKLVVTKERMEKWLANTFRDVPFNIDHKREAGFNEYGWLRIKTGEAYVAQDEQDGKYALYAQPEFTPEMFEKVKTGRVRDVSLEVDVMDDIPVGIAVTNYPRIKSLTQMSELAEEPTEGEAVFENQVSNIMELESNKKENKVSENQLTQEQINAMIASALKEQEAKYKAEIEAEKAKTREAEMKVKRAQLIMGFSSEVDELICDEKGNSVLPPAVKDDVVELFAALAEGGNVVLFSDNDEKKASSTEVLKRVLKAVGQVQAVFSQSALNVVVTPEVNGTPGYDESFANDLRDAFKRKARF